MCCRWLPQHPRLRKWNSASLYPIFWWRSATSEKKTKKGVDFINQKRAKWESSKNSAICSVHFKPEDFQRLFASLPEQSTPYIPLLNRDYFNWGRCLSDNSSRVKSDRTTTVRAQQEKDEMIWHHISLWTFQEDNSGNHVDLWPVELCHNTIWRLRVCIRAKWPIRLGIFLLPPGWDASPSQGYPQH